MGAVQVVFKDGSALRLSGPLGVEEALNAPGAQASAPVMLRQVRKTEIKGAVAAPEKSAETVEPLMSPELRAQLEQDRVAQLMIDDPVAYEQYMMDSTIERERQLASGNGDQGQGESR